MSKFRGGKGVDTPFEFVGFIVVVAAIVVGIGWAYFNYGGKQEIQDVNPVVLQDVDTETYSIEKESKFNLDVKVDHGEKIKIISFVINGEVYDKDDFEKDEDKDGLYIVSVNAEDKIGKVEYEVEKINYQLGSEDKSISILEEDESKATVSVTLTHSVPVFEGIEIVEDNVAHGTAAQLKVKFDDVEGLTQIKIDGVSYNSGTDFTVTDNAKEVIINVAGLALGDHSKVLELFVYDTGSTSVTTNLTANNTLAFKVVKAEPTFTSVAADTSTFVAADVTGDIADYNLTITMSDVSDVYSVTINGTKLLATDPSVTVNTGTNTIVVALKHTDATVGSHANDFTQFEYYNSVEMKPVTVAASNTWSISVTA